MDLLYIQDVKCTEMLRGRTRRLSSSFRDVLSRQLSPKLLRKVRQPAEAKDVYGKICLSAGRYSGYEVYRNGISALPFRIETMPWGTWVGECFVIWKSLPGKGIFAPWDDMEHEDVECGLLIDRKNTDALNRALRLSYDPKDTSPLFGVEMRVYGQARPGKNNLQIGVAERVSSAMLLEIAYLCESFARDRRTDIRIEGWPRQRGDFSIGLTVELGKEYQQAFGGLLQALEKASFAICHVQCNGNRPLV